jgi:hypothetical protein
MLFHRHRRVHGARTPAFLKRLDLICKNHRVHQLALRMVVIGESQSDRGQPMVVYACPNCNCREGWVQDRYTGRPRRLWRRGSRNGC